MVDVLVLWDDMSQNVVSLSDIKAVKKSENIAAGVKIKMYWRPERKWYYGTVLMVENEKENLSSDSEDGMSLQTVKEAMLIEKELQNNSSQGQPKLNEMVDTVDDNHYSSESDVDDVNDPTYGDHCQAGNCKREVFSACVRCLCLLCWEHFDQMRPCEDDHIERVTTTSNIPEEFVVDGCEKEQHVEKRVRENKKKKSQELRNEGKEYVSHKTGKVMPARKKHLPRCTGDFCKKTGKQCFSITDDERENLLSGFYGMGCLLRQREYLVRFVKCEEKKSKTTKAELSRRSKTNRYFLPKGDAIVPVCKTMFLNTLSVTEKTVRTALGKVKDTGVLEKEGRGGRQSHLKTKDTYIREKIMEHINKFPRMESHYCRKSTTREYLHSDLTIQKMFEMFQQSTNLTVSYQTYVNVFRDQNLSFHHPKKDMCGLCFTYRSGDSKKKAELEEKYTKHIAEKNAVRLKKAEAKRKNEEDSKYSCAVFDLQQVILLPKSNHSQIFYSRRLANYNFTIYNLQSKQCYCYIWHEGISKRGSCEISTCVSMYLRKLDGDGVETVHLFSDGCSGQNKNSIIATMLLHVLSTSQNIKSIILSFFESHHGQNEGDSVHSTITAAIEKSGDIFVPSQLVPIFRLARRRNPYVVNTLNSQEFLDFKSLARDIRILAIRKDDSGGSGINWKNVKEIMVTRNTLNKLYFKESHLTEDYRSITLNTRSSATPESEPPILNNTSPSIAAEKFKDLVTLCEGVTPVIQLAEYVQFYKTLPH